MKTRSKLAIFILSVILLVILVALVGFFLMIRSSVENSFVLENLESKNSADIKIPTKASLRALSSSTSELQSRVISSDGTVSFIDDLELAARSVGLSISMDKVGESDGDAFVYLNLQMSTDGSWNQNILFLSMLQSLPYRSTINAARLYKQVSLQQIGSVSKTVLSKTWTGSFDISVLKMK